jgi:hypothetical protein
VKNIFYFASLLFVCGCVATPNSSAGAGDGGGATTSGNGGTATVIPVGGEGGAATTSGVTITGETGGGGSGGSGGGVGGCDPTPYECQPKDCGIVANECGFLSNCDLPAADPVTCETQSLMGDDGPMSCNANTHQCECPPVKDSAAAMAACAGVATCASNAGCSPARCGNPPVPKVPNGCSYAGNLGGEPLWCCAPPCESNADCDDGNECTVNMCGPDGSCAFPPGPQTPCVGDGVCIDGLCIGGCVPTFACGVNDCGIVDDGCDDIDCGACVFPITCGPAHQCVCPPSNDPWIANSACNTIAFQQIPGVVAYCSARGGCDPAACGGPNQAGVPPHCIYGGIVDGTETWCCAKQP